MKMAAKNSTDLSETAKVFRESFIKITKGIMKLSLSTRFLSNFSQTYESNSLEDLSMTGSFQMLLNSNEIEHIRNLQIISDVFQKSVTLKLIPEDITDNYTVDISRFENLKFLEIHKVKVVHVAGIQKLRSRIQKLVCSYSVSSLSEILEKSGLDNTSGYKWDNLKEAAFMHNELTELDHSLEYSPFVHTLDLSHNLLNDVTEVNLLCHLKHLNLAYNNLQKIPQFSGLVCSRLQSLTMKNNFVEDIESLAALTNLYELDLSDNCLLDHKCLAAISHLASLQSLNLEGNPLSFHPNHRSRTCSYLHKNTSTVCFVLDHMVLKKSEKSLAGSLHPIIQRTQMSLNNSFMNDSITIPSDRPKRVREVQIQDGDVQIKTPTGSPSTFTAHLETKKQIEYLREQHGAAWLHQQSGLIVQDVLGLERKDMLLSSTPKSDDIYTSDNMPVSSPEKDNSTAVSESAFKTASDQTLDEKEDSVSIYSEDEDVDEGDECIYFCNIDDQNHETLLVVTETHISERDCITSKQRARWHINTVTNCEIVNEEGTQVQLIFDTLRRDRQKRLYTLEKSEAERLVTSLTAKMNVHRVEDKLTMYQCMKCSLTFSKKNYSYELSLSCPSCKSNLIIECTCD